MADVKTVWDLVKWLCKRVTCKHCYHLERGPASGVKRYRCCECGALDYSPHIIDQHGR